MAYYLDYNGLWRRVPSDGILSCTTTGVDYNSKNMKKPLAQKIVVLNATQLRPK